MSKKINIAMYGGVYTASLDFVGTGLHVRCYTPEGARKELLQKVKMHGPDMIAQFEEHIRTIREAMEAAE